MRTVDDVLLPPSPTLALQIGVVQMSKASDSHARFRAFTIISTTTTLLDSFILRTTCVSSCNPPHPLRGPSHLIPDRRSHNYHSSRLCSHHYLRLAIGVKSCSVGTVVWRVENTCQRSQEPARPSVQARGEASCWKTISYHTLGASSRKVQPNKGAQRGEVLNISRTFLYYVGIATELTTLDEASRCSDTSIRSRNSASELEHVPKKALHHHWKIQIGSLCV